MRTPFSTSDPCWFRHPASGRTGRVTSIIGSGALVDTIVQELAHAGIAAQPHRELVPDAELVIARRELLEELAGQRPELRELTGHPDRIATVGAEGFAILGSRQRVVVTAADDAGLLYGFFHLLRLGDGPWRTPTALVSNPDHPLRVLNHWDNLSENDPLGLGSVERGYAGDSIFFRDDALVADTDRIVDYGRLLASVGINALSVNNVNVHPVEATLLTTRLPLVRQIADLLRPYGVKLYLSVNFASPIMLGGLSTADPAVAEVTDWWRAATEQVYEQIPDFGGFVVKADSEGQPGPFTYGRGHAEGANMFATILEPHGGIVFWRAFVYNHLQDWRDRRTDRARAAYDHFMPIDGAFADNVVLQIKNGPMDFQPREPVSPLLLGLERTNIALEVQLTQEYSGHQKHVGYLVPQWKDALDFGPSNGDQAPTVAQRLASRPLSAISGVVNVGDSPHWTGHPLAQANLYGYGRLAWDNTLTPERILTEWMHQTLGDDAAVNETVADIMLDSLAVYESYTAPLGVGWMVTPGTHYGPSVDGYEYSPWGNYHFADRDGVGVDRTSATGTGYAQQYPPAWADVYDDLTTCPDELLLFFHHVPYGHVLHSGKTVIQHIYDTHFAGVERVEQMQQQWADLAGRVDPKIFEEVTDRLAEQLRSAKEWCDQVNSYFYRKSGVPDAHGRSLY